VPSSRPSSPRDGGEPILQTLTQIGISKADAVAALRKVTVKMGKAIAERGDHARGYRSAPWFLLATCFELTECRELAAGRGGTWFVKPLTDCQCLEKALPRSGEMPLLDKAAAPMGQHEVLQDLP